MANLFYKMSMWEVKRKQEKQESTVVVETKGDQARLWLVCGSCYFQSLVSKEEEAREQEKIKFVFATNGDLSFDLVGVWWVAADLTNSSSICKEQKRYFLS